jgi:hypothetical protein
MGDLLFVVVVIAFFAVCVLFVRACDAIIGPDPESAPSSDQPEPAVVETTAT